MANVNDHLRMGAAGIAIVKAFESCMAPVPGRPGYFMAYVDPVGVLTIGWGHTNHHEPKFNGAAIWSRAECDAALVRDLAIFENVVRRNAKVPLKQCEFDALVSWAYNTGGPSTASLWTALNRGDKAIIPAKLDAWNRGGGRVLNGLVRRRKAEGLLFQGRIAEAYRVAQIPLRSAAIIAPPGKPPPDVPKPKPIAPAAPSWWQAIFNLFRGK
jgi:lysozyme